MLNYISALQFFCHVQSDNHNFAKLDNFIAYHVQSYNDSFAKFDCITYHVQLVIYCAIS